MFAWMTPPPSETQTRTYNHASVLSVTGRVETGHGWRSGPDFSARRQRFSITYIHCPISTGPVETEGQ